jgi:hypothetical protein
MTFEIEVHVRRKGDGRVIAEKPRRVAAGHRLILIL